MAVYETKNIGHGPSLRPAPAPLLRIVVVVNPILTYGLRWALPRCGSAPYQANKSKDHIPVRQMVTHCGCKLDSHLRASVGVSTHS